MIHFFLSLLGFHCTAIRFTRNNHSANQLPKFMQLENKIELTD